MDVVIPLTTLILGTLLGGLATYLVGRKQRTDERKDELRSVSRLLYEELRSSLGTLHAERVYPGDFLGRAHTDRKGAELPSAVWNDLRPRFAALLSGDDFAGLEELHSSLRHASSYPVREEWSENGDSPARGIIGEYREDYIDEWITETTAAVELVGEWAGYGSGRVEEATRVPPLEPHSWPAPEGADVLDLHGRIRRHGPTLKPWMVELLAADVERLYFESEPEDRRSKIAVRLARFGFRDEDDPYDLESDELTERADPNVLADIWDWVRRNLDRHHGPAEPSTSEEAR